ncbi:MAG: hypothetical protein ACPG4T_02465 [Nannocystaceae bacterium]
MRDSRDPFANRRSFILGAGATALGACALGSNFLTGAAHAATAIPNLKRISSNEVEALAEDLGAALGITVGKRQEVGRRLRKFLWGSRFQRVLESPGVTGVAAFRMGSGGLFVRHARGKGLVAFGDETFATQFKFSSTTVGAHLGGSGTWGVMLIVGLREAPGFGGQYRTNMRGATAAEASRDLAVMHRHKALDSRHVHDVYFVGASHGLSADAGAGGLRIRVGDRVTEFRNAEPTTGGETVPLSVTTNTGQQ